MGWVWGGESLIVTPEQVDPEYRFRFPSPSSLPSKEFILQLKNVYPPNLLF